MHIYNERCCYDVNALYRWGSQTMYMVWCKLGEGCWGCIGIIHEGEFVLENRVIRFSICSAEKGQRVVRTMLVISTFSGEVVVSWKGSFGFELRNEHWWMGCQKVNAYGSIWCVVIVAWKGADSLLVKGWFVSIFSDDGVGEGILRIRTPTGFCGLLLCTLGGSFERALN